jgi:hypothetical protein
VAASPKKTGATYPSEGENRPGLLLRPHGMNSNFFNPLWRVGVGWRWIYFYVPFIFWLPLKIRFREKNTGELLEMRLEVATNRICVG